MNLYEANIAQANKYFLDRKFDKAVTMLGAAEAVVSDTDPIDKNLLSLVKNFKGNCFLNSKDFTSAEHEFISAIDSMPSNAEPLTGLSQICLQKNEEERALFYAKQAFEMEPQNKVTVLNYGKVLDTIGLVNEAQKHYLNYLRKHPNDLDVMESLLISAKVDEKKKQSSTQLILVTGVHGAGKTTYADSLGYPVFHIDNFFSYQQDALNYRALGTSMDFVNYYINNTLDFLVIDGYPFHKDLKIEQLKKIINPINKVNPKLVYTNNEELYQSQRSNEERRKSREKENLSKDEAIRWNQKIQLGILDRLEYFIQENIVDNIDFIYREENSCNSTSREHFINTIGKVTDWSLNKWELLHYVKQNETQAYQTIEVDGEIIRPGTEKCWLSWENILKLDIDWKDKKVCDLGSYFGYFSLKILQNGAKEVVGIDQSKTLTDVYETVLSTNKFDNFRTQAIALGNGNNLPDEKFDIIIALNMLHHIEKSTTPEHYKDVIYSIFKNADQAVFEINDYQIEEITNIALLCGWILNKKIRSHRNTSYGQRYIMHFVKSEFKK